MSKTYELSYSAERIDEILKEVDEHTIYSDATTEEHGLMSAQDKTKLDALPTAQQIDVALNAKVDKEVGKGLSKNDYTDAEKESVASAYHKPQSGIPKTDLASDVQTSLEKADTAANASDVYTKSEVDEKMVRVYKPAGNATLATLGSLDYTHEGFTYNMTEDFTTTANFVEGAGKKYSAGANVAIVNVGTVQEPVYKYDVLGGGEELPDNLVYFIDGSTHIVLVDETTTFDGSETGTINLFNDTLTTPIHEGHVCQIALTDPSGVVVNRFGATHFNYRINNGNMIEARSSMIEFVASETIERLRIYVTNIQYTAEATGNVTVTVTDMGEEYELNLKTLEEMPLMSHEDFFHIESDWWAKEKFLEDAYSTDETSDVNNFISTIRQRAGTGIFQIAVISDTHGSGAYSWRDIRGAYRLNASCYRSIAVFNKIAADCDAALHGGDISCDYGTSRNRVLQYMYAIMRLFRFADKPFFITKGNHDENNNGYVEVTNPVYLDWTENNYFVRSFNTFTQVTEDTWDGSPLYVQRNELVSDREFRSMVQHWMSPSGATWGDGAYYFYDFEDAKIRFIVANSFPVNNNHDVAEDEEYLWFAQTALNLSAKDDPQKWQVIVLRHTESTSIEALSDCINAFQNGTSWTYGETTVDFGTMNGDGCTFIAHVHGHEHANMIANAKGYFDIGENKAFVSLDKLGDAKEYGISVLSIDTVNKLIYEDTIGGKSWVYDYDHNLIVLNVDDTITAAESGLESPTLTSSDTSVATVEGMVITAVAAGTATITLTSGTQTLQYYVSVQSSNNE